MPYLGTCLWKPADTRILINTLAPVERNTLKASLVHVQ